MKDWIDVTVAIRDGMVHWPDNPPIVVERVQDMARGDGANVSKLSLGVHTGTHVDAPVHFDSSKPGVDAIPLAALCGPARVIEIADPREVTVTELAAADIRAGERILLKTRNSPAAWQAPSFVEDAVHLTVDAARWLAARPVKTVGIDYLSVGGFTANNGHDVHHALLDAGVWIIEGLDLTHVPPGACELICLPLKIAGADGAPARAIVRPTAG
jgi:arylformamidase